MLTLKEEVEQELVEWRKVIGDIESHCARYQPSKYLTLLKSRAKQNLEHLQKRLGNDSSQLEPLVMQKATVIWVTFDEYGDLESEFIYPETEENKMPYQLEKYLMHNKNKTAKRFSCFSA